MLAQQKQQVIKDAFANWVWQDPQRRIALVKQYNELFNSTRPREYDGSHIHFVGMNPEITIREHQRNAIAHVLYGGNTLLAHEVGAGKTYEMAASAMEAKRLGLCQKSLFVVPNHLTEQWASEFLNLYPNAKLLVARRKDFETANRKKFCARIATGDYDAVIIGHSQFERIPLSFERQERIIQEQIYETLAAINELKVHAGENFSIKQMEKTRKTLETKLEKLRSDERKDDVITFEQLGVDLSLIHIFSYTVVDGEVFYRENSVMTQVELSDTAKGRVTGMVELRQIVNELIDQQLNDYPDEDIKATQAKLNAAYDAFTAKYGLLNDRRNGRLFEQDSSYYLLCSLENLDEQGQLKSKAAMFTKRTIRPERTVTSVDTPSEALAVSIGEHGKVDLPYMAELLGTPGDYGRITSELSGVIFKDPAADPTDPEAGWQMADEYLSGDVRAKLRMAQFAAETNPEFVVNVDALTKAQPRDCLLYTSRQRAGCSRPWRSC